MKQVDMKSEPRKMEQPTSIGYQDSEYPYGLRIYLEEEQIAKLGIKGIPAVGSYVDLEAIAEIQCVSMNENEEGARRCITLQITGLGVAISKAKESADERLYGKSS